VLPPGSRATSRRPGIAPIRVGQSYEFDGVRLDEQPGSPPTVHTWAREVDVERAESVIAETARNADMVVVALHWGVPWCFLPANQGPLAEYQQPLAHRLIDAGARVLVGHHAHAVQPLEFYGGGVVLYSTGNFLFHETAQQPADHRRITPALKPILRTGPWLESAVFDITVEAEAVSVRPLLIELDGNGEPVHARPHVARRILQYLYDSSRELDPRVVMTDEGVFAGGDT
jgi:poly-gamma-glutamate synthesis protein (capsule biosynthesis protein)